ncbi:hypothetical protein NDU88_004676 [Pleurodeles waltl]|uniref:Uncharacterized protein n=1 Tax=Pleurodeles waltl TaxID=8319 RepID=A0AAV7WWI1_PLEWA|nr:hypothetical protein NDU88_004676 [Pleurodeles waltl]
MTGERTGGCGSENETAMAEAPAREINFGDSSSVRINNTRRRGRRPVTGAADVRLLPGYLVLSWRKRGPRGSLHLPAFSESILTRSTRCAAHSGSSSRHLGEFSVTVSE